MAQASTYDDFQAEQRKYDIDWLTANERIRSCPQAAIWIAAQYSHERDGRRTAVCAAAHNTPFWQEAVARVAASSHRSMCAADIGVSK